MAVGADSEDSHQCEWREKATALEGRLASIEADKKGLEEQLTTIRRELDSLTRRLLGPKSERLPSMQEELRGGEPVPFEEVLKKRRERAKQKAKLETVTEVYRVADAEKRCPKCGRTDLKPLGEGAVSTLYDYKPARLVAVRQVQETLSCPCGEHVVRAQGPTKWKEKSRYSVPFVAHVVTAKCADSIPLYRLEKEFQRLGMPVSRSTLTDMFHSAADLLEPLSQRLLQKMREAEVVHADETSMKVQAEDACRNGFVWTFRTTQPQPLIAYRFSPSRSGETPMQLLGGTNGALVVDGYTGYNSVTAVNGRTRVGCHAHVRRYFFEALPSAPQAREALDFIREMYRIEAAVFEARIPGTPQHLKLRREKSAPLRDAFKTWLDKMQGEHPPKSPLGVAIRYTLNQWDVLGRFLDDARIPLDNNPAESALRRVALGRKNFLFVGNDDAGDNLAGLYSLVATCEANGVNPLAYLTDVLIRVHEHPNSRLDELLPPNWRGPPADAKTASA
jgi:transposase